MQHVLYVDGGRINGRTNTNLRTRYYRNDDKQKQEDNLSSDRTTQKSNNNSVHLPQIGLTCM